MAAEKKLPWLKPRHSQTGSMDPGRSLFTLGQKLELLDKARSMLEAWEVAVELWLGKSDTTRI